MLNKLPDAWIGHIAGCLLGKPVPIDTYIDQFTYQFITDQGVVSIQSGKIRECTLYSEKYVRIEVMAELVQCSLHSLSTKKNYLEDHRYSKREKEIL